MIFVFVFCPECVGASSYRKRTGRNHRKGLSLRLEQTAIGALKSGHYMLIMCANSLTDWRNADVVGGEILTIRESIYEYIRSTKRKE